MVICSIDPGASGAIAFLSASGYLLEVVDMPTIEVKGKKRVCSAQLADIICARKPSIVVIEGVNSRPGQAVTAVHIFGYSAGLCEGIAAGAGIPNQVISAATWKRKAGVPADKGAVRQMASRLWPGAASRFSRVKDDGRADAALLGHWYAVTQGAQS